MNFDDMKFMEKNTPDKFIGGIMTYYGAVAASKLGDWPVLWPYPFNLVIIPSATEISPKSDITRLARLKE